MCFPQAANDLTTMIRQAILILIFSLLGAGATHLFHPRAPKWGMEEGPLEDDEVNVAAIQERWKDNVMWVDARVTSEFTKGHVPGALSLNEQNFDQVLFDNMQTFQNLKRPLVIYCDSEKCDASRKIREELLKRMPLENVFILKGGWQAWNKAHKERFPPGISRRP